MQTKIQIQVNLISKAMRFSATLVPLQVCVLGNQGKKGLGGEAAVGKTHII